MHCRVAERKDRMQRPLPEEATAVRILLSMPSLPDFVKVFSYLPYLSSDSAMLPLGASAVVLYGVMQWWYTAHAVSFVPCICICCAALARTADKLNRNIEDMLLLLRLV